MLPASGNLTRFQPPAGRGIRVDTHGYPGYVISPRYDPLLVGELKPLRLTTVSPQNLMEAEETGVAVAF